MHRATYDPVDLNASISYLPRLQPQCLILPLWSPFLFSLLIHNCGRTKGLFTHQRCRPTLHTSVMLNTSAVCVGWTNTAHCWFYWQIYSRTCWNKSSCGWRYGLIFASLYVFWMKSFCCLMLDMDIMMEMPVHPRRVCLSRQCDMPRLSLMIQSLAFSVTHCPALCYGLFWFFKVIFRMTLLSIIGYQF